MNPEIEKLAAAGRARLFAASFLKDLPNKTRASSNLGRPQPQSSSLVPEHTAAENRIVEEEVAKCLSGQQTYLQTHANVMARVIVHRTIGMAVEQILAGLVSS